ncbi:MAG TPA: hypothetical protein VF407_14600 [Polyangiaceae bacterium]
MVKDPFRGKTFDFVFTDGQMANKTFTHTFGDDGTVTFTMGGTDAKASSKESESEGKDEGSGVQKKPEPVPYTFATLRDGIAAMSYKSAAGYTLTCILDFETGKLVSFASGEKMSEMANGIFEDVGSTKRIGGGAKKQAAHAHN